MAFFLPINAMRHLPPSFALPAVKLNAQVEL
jgi:hypothetical protein